MRELEPLLTDTTRVARLWGSSSGHPGAKARGSHPPRAGNLCEVYPGSDADGSGRAWLTHEQISQGALTALRSDCRERTVGDLIGL